MEMVLIHRSDRKQLLFNVPKPKTKVDWTVDFENISLLSTGDNNPGWYIPDEVVCDSDVVNTRRSLPLVASIQPLFMIKPQTTVSHSMGEDPPFFGSPQIFRFFRDFWRNSL